MSSTAVSDDKENAPVSLHPLGKSARITRAAAALKDISNTVHIRDRATSGLTTRDKPSQPAKRGQPAEPAAEDVVAPLPSIRSARASPSPYDFSSVESLNDASAPTATTSSVTSAKPTRTRRASISIITASSSSTPTLVSTSAASSSLALDLYADKVDHPLTQREVTGVAIGDSSGSNRGYLFDISANRAAPASSLTLSHILTNKLSATKFIEVAQRRLLAYQSNNTDLARDNARMQSHSKQHTHERKVLSQRCKQLGELVRIYKGRVDEVVEGLERREEERERERVEEEKERVKEEERQRVKENEMRRLRDRLDKARDELREEKKTRREEASQREEEDRERMEHSSSENERERMLSVQVKQSAAEVQRLQQRVDELLKEKEQTDGREEQLRRVSEARADEHDKERQQLQRDIKEKAQQLQQVSDARDKALAELRVLTDDVTSIRLTAEELGDRVTLLQDSNEQLQVQLQQLEEMKETYASQSKHVQRLASQLAESEQARDELSQQLDDNEVELAVTREELDGIENAYRQLSGSYGKLREVVVELSEQLNSVRETMAGMRDDEQRQQQQLSTTEQHVHQLVNPQSHTHPIQLQHVSEAVSSQSAPPSATVSPVRMDEQEEMCRLWDMQMRLEEEAHEQSDRLPFITAGEANENWAVAEVHPQAEHEAVEGWGEVEDENQVDMLN